MKIKLYFLDLRDFSRYYEDIYNSLSVGRKTIVDEYPDIEEKIVHALSSWLIDKYSGEGEILYSRYGKPYKNEKPYFNVAHSGNLVIIATSEKEVGIDIELVKEYKQTLKLRAFNEEIGNKIKTNLDFYSYWTRKESLGKCVGTGLIWPVKDIPCEEGVVKYLNHDFYIKTNMLTEKYVLSICSTEEFDFEIEELVSKQFF